MLPWHPIVIHLSVVMVPFACVATIVHVTKPRWRWFLRWPVNLGWLAAFVAVVLGRVTGDARLDHMTEFSRALHNHTGMADLMLLLLMPTMLLAWFGCFSLDAESPLESGFGGNADRQIKATKPMAWATVVLSLAILVLMALTAYWGWYSVWRT